MVKKIGLQNIDYSKVVDHGTNPSFYRQLSPKIIQYIENNESVSFQEIIKYVGGGERRIIRLLDQMVQKKMLIYQSSRFHLSKQKGKCPYAISDIRCPACDSKIVYIDGKMKALLEFMNNVVRARPKSTFIFDQRPVNPETIVRRVAYAIWRGDLQNKKIVLLGDDDLTSIAIAKTGMAKEIVVFDIDTRITDLIKSISEKYNFKIQTVKYDLLRDIPNRYTNYFDTFITDPTPTVKPLSLFTIRGLEMLQKQPGKAGYISLYPSHMELDIDFQKNLSEMNLLITDQIPFFNQYEIVYHTLTPADIELMKKYGAYKKSISFYEYLMRIETTDTSRLIDLRLSSADLMGKATLKALKDPMSDPVLSQKNVPISIKKAVDNLKRNSRII